MMMTTTRLVTRLVKTKKMMTPPSPRPLLLWIIGTLFLAFSSITTTTTGGLIIGSASAAFVVRPPFSRQAQNNEKHPEINHHQHHQQAIRSLSRQAVNALVNDNDDETALENNNNIAKVVDVVLFGVGDLRQDDHGGLRNALFEKSATTTSILPLAIFNDDMLSHLPGAIAHTIDAAKLLSAALSDLDANLQNVLGAPLHVKLLSNTDSLEDFLLDIRNQLEVDRLRVHVSDLGDVDNALGYGAFSQLSSLSNSNSSSSFLEVVSWNSHLRDEPWNNVEDLPLEYPAYESLYNTASVPPIKPVSVHAILDREDDKDGLTKRIHDSSFISLQHLQFIPSAETLVDLLVDTLDLDMQRCIDEQNTGLYGTHWGGLDAATIGSTAVLETLTAFATDCGEDDIKWFQHTNFVGRGVKRNERSLEHASMEWQLQLRGNDVDGGDSTANSNNWLSGESIVRYLAAPLLYGTVSQRRIWHMSKLRDPFYTSPLKRLVEAREWHRLLAARNIRTDSDYRQEDNKEEGMTTKYMYWRYHGFLCRYAQTNFDSASNDDATSTTSSSHREGVLLVHGFGASGSQWNKAIKELGKLKNNIINDSAVCQAFAPDLIGFGQSEKPVLSYTGYAWDAMTMDFMKEQVLPLYKWTSFVVGGNSIGGFTSMSLAAVDSAKVASREVTSSGAPGTGLCNGLVLMNSAGPCKTRDEIQAEQADAEKLQTVAQLTALDALPPCSPPPRPVARMFGNALLWYLRPQIQSICSNLYPTNPAAVDNDLCESICRDSLDPGAINVMMSGAKLPMPRTANELLQADFGCAPTTAAASPLSVDFITESSFTGPVLIAQGVLDPLNDAVDRMNRFGALREGITTDPLQGGHCPHDELPKEMARSIATWMSNTRSVRIARGGAVATSSTSTPASVR